ncbi:MAG: HAMP domain-containing histidine kinase [Clostridia bacterium]|nr:HAMP domain-containing histidine kinase [Clostridia bacterium]
MFRSLFARMLVTISLILTVSFLILSLILANFVTDYESDARRDELDRTALGGVRLLSESLLLEERDDLSAMLEATPSRYGTYFRVYLSNTEDMVLLICDTEGRVLLAANGTDEPPSYRGMSLADGLAAGIFEGRGTTGNKAIFVGEEPSLFSAYPVNTSNGTPVGIVVTLSVAAPFGGMTETLIRTVLLTSLWIILGALVVLYLFCERVAGPLREMSHVTKSFAKGHFDRRVTVVGCDEIATLGVAFNQMADSLEQLETMRNSFISNVSHDLRTPMTTILGFIEGLNSGAIPEEKREYYLGVISEEVRRLSRLVTELLDLSRLQSGTRKFDFSPFDICEMARLVLIANEQRIDERRLEVDFTAEADNILVLGDRDAIHQVLYNLCDNAIKFAKEGGAFRITIAPVSRRKIGVTVYNEGEGIPADDIPFVFERFYKSDKSRGRDKTGAGLGLYISKTIMDAHGEDLTLKSEEGHSCAFTFTLPLVGE